MSQKIDTILGQFSVLSGRISAVAAERATFVTQLNALHAQVSSQNDQLLAQASQIAELQAASSTPPAATDADLDNLSTQLGSLIDSVPEVAVAAPVEPTPAA